jgi:hypothetical protein
LYVDFLAESKIILVNIYAKNEKENISDTDKKRYKKIIINREGDKNE